MQPAFQANKNVLQIWGFIMLICLLSVNLVIFLVLGVFGYFRYLFESVFAFSEREAMELALKFTFPISAFILVSIVSVTLKCILYWGMG